MNIFLGVVAAIVFLWLLRATYRFLRDHAALRTVLWWVLIIPGIGAYLALRNSGLSGLKILLICALFVLLSPVGLAVVFWLDERYLKSCDEAEEKKRADPEKG